MGASISALGLMLLQPSQCFWCLACIYYTSLITPSHLYLRYFFHSNVPMHQYIINLSPLYIQYFIIPPSRWYLWYFLTATMIPATLSHSSGPFSFMTSPASSQQQMCFYFQLLLMQWPLKCCGAVSSLDQAPTLPSPPPCAISHVCRPPSPLPVPWLHPHHALPARPQIQGRCCAAVCCSVLQCAALNTSLALPLPCCANFRRVCSAVYSALYSAVCSGSVQCAARRWDWRTGPALGAFPPCCLHSCGAPGETAGPAGVELAGPQPGWPAPGPVLCRSAFSTAAGSTDRVTPRQQGHGASRKTSCYGPSGPVRSPGPPGLLDHLEYLYVLDHLDHLDQKGQLVHLDWPTWTFWTTWTWSTGSNL